MMFFDGKRLKKIVSLVTAVMMAGSVYAFDADIAEASVNIYDTKSEDGKRHLVVEEKENETAEAESITAESAVQETKQRPAEKLKLVRLSWEAVPGAVGYQLIITKKPEDTSDKAIFVKNGIFNTGFELDLGGRRDMWDCYWSICPVNSYCEAIGDYSVPKPMSDAEWNPKSPMPTTEFDKMSYSLVYPAFSWIPVSGAHSYELMISREDDTIPGKFDPVRNFRTSNNIYYEQAGYTWPGKYRWQVRAKDTEGNIFTKWSEPKEFTVETHVKVAALGDSITHGGGVSSIPPGYTLYDWETYCQVPVKNIGLSGDTVQGMLERFGSEVVPLRPDILVIMGGVNNFRAGEDAWETIDAMERLRDKCVDHNIIPVFLTATPINEGLISQVPTIGTPASNWKFEQQVLNCWIKQQKFWVDVTPKMTDKNGRLRADWTTDGLHPDYEGKKLIGEMVGSYLLKTFPYLDLLQK